MSPLTNTMDLGGTPQAGHPPRPPQDRRDALRPWLLLPLLLLLGIVGATSPALAGVSQHPGTICKNYDYWNLSAIAYSVKGGVYSKSPGAIKVICPVVSHNYGAEIHGAIVYVYVWHYDAQMTECTVSSIAPPNDVVTLTRSATGPGVHELHFPFSIDGLPTAAAGRDYSVICTIPKYGYGEIRGIDLIE